MRAAAWICLAAALIVALLPAGGLAVCIGADGHVGLDARPEDRSLDVGCPCTSDIPAGREVPHACSAEHAPCQDLSFTAPDLVSEQRTLGDETDHSAPPPPAPVTAAVAAAEPIIRRERWPLLPAPLNRALVLRHLRTIVLLV